jgi:hypothetical protein
VEVAGSILEVEAPMGAAELGQQVRISSSTAHAFPNGN